jgi:hypothetical protein
MTYYKARLIQKMSELIKIKFQHFSLPLLSFFFRVATINHNKKMMIDLSI